MMSTWILDFGPFSCSPSASGRFLIMGVPDSVSRGSLSSVKVAWSVICWILEVILAWKISFITLWDVVFEHVSLSWILFTMWHKIKISHCIIKKQSKTKLTSSSYYNFSRQNLSIKLDLLIGEKQCFLQELCILCMEQGLIRHLTRNTMSSLGWQTITHTGVSIIRHFAWNNELKKNVSYVTLISQKV